MPRRPRPSLLGRLLSGALKLSLILALLTIVWVGAYAVINPPTTATMIGDLGSGRGARRSWLPLDRIDPDMARAAIAAEDSKFCAHDGFDREAIGQAIESNRRGRRIRGGSTISQQTAKNAFLWKGGGFFRKGLEACFTLLIERVWGKRRIMEVYLNIAETGIGTYGANAGARRYFGHDASRLSPAEAARIAAVLPLPKKREAVAPSDFTRRYGRAIAARMAVVRRDGLDACLYGEGQAPAPDGSEPPIRVPQAPRRPLEEEAPLPPIPAEEYEPEPELEPVADAPDEPPLAPQLEGTEPPPEDVPALSPEEGREAPQSEDPGAGPPPVED